MSSPAIQEHDMTVLLGDVREQLALLAAGSINCIVTSPPYYGLRDYGVDGQIGLEPSPAEYVAEMVAVFREARRVLADDGVLWLNIGDSYVGSANSGGANGDRPDGSGRYSAGAAVRVTGLPSKRGLPAKNLLGIPWRVAFGLQDDGWILRNAVIWSKPNAMPESVTDRLSTRYEHVFLFSKSRRYRFNLDAIREGEQWQGGRTWEQRKALGEPMRYGTAGQAAVGVGGFTGSEKGRNPGDVWSIGTQPFPGSHFATMPPALAERCIKAGCPDDGIVLDPFAGSGTTLMTARKLGRKSVGIELNPAYIDIIRARIGPEPFNFGEVTA